MARKCKDDYDHGKTEEEPLETLEDPEYLVYDVTDEDYIQLDKQSFEKEDEKKIKSRKKIANNKKGRIIIRNLSYKVTEETLRAKFENFGEISEINLLKKSDGKLVGCAFIQYFNYVSSVNAIKSMNGQAFLNRKITVDFAVSKNRYQNICKYNEKEGVKVEASDTVHKDDDDDDSNNNGDLNKQENDTKMKFKVGENKKSNVNDSELTIFVKNLSFETTNEDLTNCFKKFGPIKYALVVNDPVSGHSKGTAFVKFMRKESVEMCLTQSGKIILQDFAVEIFPSLPKQTIKNIEKQKEDSKKETKDNRNLYLMREGMILAGSDAASGLSATDMAKRLRLEQIKSSMVKNLTRFISRERLTIHNIPENYDDAKLRKVIISKTNLKPIECRVMRENKPSSICPEGKSKGFGFISFKRHEDALAVLRVLNNNPEVFSASHRPIVSFSIEDMSVLKIKERRQQHSMINNPTYKTKMEKIKAKKLKHKMDKKSIIATGDVLEKRTESNEPTLFSGFQSKPGAFVKLRGTFKLKQQSKIHEKSMRELNKKNRREKQLNYVFKEKEEKKSDRVSSKRKIDETDSLASKINKYKILICNNQQINKQKTRGKWYLE